MSIIILGLKEKSNGSYLVYDVNGGDNHISIKVNQVKKIPILSPFPFSNFSSLDKFDQSKYEKCYLEVDAEITDSEFYSMKSSGIVYHRFRNRDVTFLRECHDIFQYSLAMLESFGERLGTYNLLTWVIHNKTKNKLEHKAMKEIIFSGVSKGNNKEYPLDISLDIYTLEYIDYFRQLSKEGYNITFGRYGSTDRKLLENKKAKITEESFLYLLENFVFGINTFIKHTIFTVDFYEKHIKSKEIEKEVLYSLEVEDISDLKVKGFNVDGLYFNYFENMVNKFNQYHPEYENFFEIFYDEEVKPRIEHTSPYDYYCCEDCDGYDIHDSYTQEELDGEDFIIDERVDYVEELVGVWGEHLTADSYILFNRVPIEFIEMSVGKELFDKIVKYREVN